MLLWSSCKINVKKCEGCAILPNLQGNKLSCHGCWQRHDTPGSEIKDSSLLTSITVAGISAFFLSSPSPSSHRVNWHWHVYWLCYRREGTPKFYNGQYACQTFGPRKRHHFFFFYQILNKLTLCSTRRYYIFQGWSLQTSLTRYSERKVLSASTSKTCRNARDPWRIVAQ